MSVQSSLFDDAGRSEGGPQRLDLPEADVLYYATCFPRAEADRLLDELDETTIWGQDSMKMYGKVLPFPRLTAWYGDPGRVYRYSGVEMEPRAWTEPLLEIKRRI